MIKSRSFKTRFYSVLLSATILSACGSSNNRLIPFDAVEAQRLTSASAPAEEVADQVARAAAIGPNIDRLAVSTLHGETDNPALETFAVPGVCTGTTCVFTEPTTTISVEINTENLLDTEDDVGSVRAVLTRNGITLLEGSGGERGRDYRVYGAWMEHAGFAVETRHETERENIKITYRGGQAVGDSTGDAPSADATYHGVMVGTPATGDNSDDILQGDARLVYAFDTYSIDVHFENIKNLDRNADHSVTEITFEDIVVIDNTYSVEHNDQMLSGAFVGPAHAETAGVFEKDGVVGAFGAKKIGPSN